MAANSPLVSIFRRHCRIDGHRFAVPFFTHSPTPFGDGDVPLTRPSVLMQRPVTVTQQLQPLLMPNDAAGVRERSDPRPRHPQHLPNFLDLCMFPPGTHW